MKTPEFFHVIDARLEAGPAAWRWFDWFGIVLVFLVGPSLLGYAMTDGLLWLVAHHLLGAAVIYVAFIWTACGFFYRLSDRHPQNKPPQSEETQQ